MGAAWLLRRLVASIAIIFAVVTFVFILIHVAPGRPCPENLDPAVCNELNRQFGLDRSIPEQYWRYLVALAHGNLGYSFADGRPVRAVIAGTIPFTFQLAGAALLLDCLLGLGLGISQAVRVNRLPDVVLGNVTLFIYSLPTFCLAPLLLLDFGTRCCPHSPSVWSELREPRGSSEPRCWRWRRRITCAPPAPRASRNAGWCCGINSATPCFPLSRGSGWPFPSCS